jgi:hypothetical protein
MKKSVFHINMQKTIPLLLLLMACTVLPPEQIQPPIRPPIPPEPVCKDLCGDGICQEVVCLAIGCPCAETPQSCPQDCKVSQEITNFEQCARAGYPIMESYPRQCRADGKTFVEEAITEVCRYPQDCGEGYFCRFGVCTEFTPETNCKTDEDCQLINKEYGFSCCYIGACQIINYSEEKWMAVNVNWFANGHEQYCPTKGECGPAPMCPVQSIDENYHVKCIKGNCIKVKIETIKLNAR